MKKIALSNFIFGLLSFIYFIVFARLSITVEWLSPDKQDRAAIPMSIIFTIFLIIESIVSVYLMLSGGILKVIMKGKVISAAFLSIDSILKAIFTFVCVILALILIVLKYFPAGISAALYTVILLTLAIVNVKSLEKSEA